eukprot:gb/GEZN01001935.1/.p1 GENE.gb/GEZN01001935.1/~~gb/GEZN01001935.1/.p1  ORF type:complete len:698 (-),score=75.59 gb/GEZN01001935.1/:592-2685(-)
MLKLGFYQRIMAVTASGPCRRSIHVTSALRPSQTLQQHQHRRQNNQQNQQNGPRMGYDRMGANAMAVAAITAMLYWSKDHIISTANACGIMGYLGDHPAQLALLEGLLILQNRGYDSAGMSTLEPNLGLVTTKHASKGSTSDSLEILTKGAPKHHPFGTTGIAHTRWATHGGKTDENAHPHHDYKNRIALVHNGTIANCNVLKKELLAKGIPFASETDTEVISNLIGTYLDQDMPLLDAVQSALIQLEGTWGLAIIDKNDPGTILAARNGSPLVIGIGQHEMFIASEVSAFSRRTRDYIALKDGEIAVVTKDGVSLDMSRIQKAPKMVIELSSAPYAHWTLKEIMEQPNALARSLGFGGRFESDGNIVKLGGLNDNRALMLGIDNFIISACGTSYFASLYACLIMRDLGCFNTVQAFDAAEVTPQSFPLHRSGFCAVSQSGETKDTHRSVEMAQGLNVPCLSVVNSVGSLIARTTGMGVYTNAGRENAVASTKAFSTQVTCLALIAAWFAQNRPFAEEGKRRVLMDAIHRLPIYSGMALQTHGACKKIAQKLKDKQHMFILGKGYGEPIAREGALKIKEIAYIHAEGYGGGSLKHGPFALLEDGTPVVMLILDDQHSSLMCIAAEEVKARGTYNIIITDNPALCQGLYDDLIVIPSNGPLTALLATFPLQLLAYEISIAKGINPDKPRNLAKAVTVD